MLRLDHARDGRAGPIAARELAVRAGRELDDYLRGDRDRTDIEGAMDGLREAAAG